MKEPSLSYAPIGVCALVAACIDKALLAKLSQSQVGWVGTENRRRNDCQVLNLSERAKTELKRIRLYNDFPQKNRAQVITLVVPPDLNVTTESMQAMGLRCRVFEGGLLRIGFHYCNVPSDIDRLFECLKKVEA